MKDQREIEFGEPAFIADVLSAIGKIKSELADTVAGAIVAEPELLFGIRT